MLAAPSSEANHSLPVHHGGYVEDRVYCRIYWCLDVSVKAISLEPHDADHWGWSCYSSDLDLSAWASSTCQALQQLLRWWWPSQGSAVSIVHSCSLQDFQRLTGLRASQSVPSRLWVCLETVWQAAKTCCKSATTRFSVCHLFVSSSVHRQRIHVTRKVSSETYTDVPARYGWSLTE